MKILLLGATGRTGKWVLDYALKAGYEVHCLSRKTERINTREGLTVFEGNPIIPEDLERAIESCKSVISVLNISRTSDFPWAKLRTPKNYLSKVMKNLVSISEGNKIERIVLCSAWGVSETKKDLPGWFRWFINNSNIGLSYNDHERQEKILSESKLNWTIIRPVGLTNSKSEQGIKESFGNTPKPSLLISRKSVARYLMDSLKNDELIRAKVVISKA